MSDGAPDPNERRIVRDDEPEGHDGTSARDPRDGTSARDPHDANSEHDAHDANSEHDAHDANSEHDAPRESRPPRAQARADASATGVVVPWARLSSEALRGVVEEFITREGTEYGTSEVALDQKIAQVQRQLERGEVVVLFDAAAETVNLVRATELPRAE